MIHGCAQLLLLATPWLQDGGSPPRPDAGQGWLPVDGVVAQVGDEVITRSAVYEFLDRQIRLRGLSTTTPEELDEALAQARETLVLFALESQAGEDQDLRPAGQAERDIERFLARRRRAVGLGNYADNLVNMGISAQRYKEHIASQGRIDSFRQAGLAGPRPTRDNYIRPGSLRRRYQVDRAKLSEPDRVRFQLIDILGADVGGVDAARTLAEEVLRRLDEGEDFGLLNEEFSRSYRATLGRTDFMSEVPDPAVAAFAQGAAEGEVSAPLPLVEPGGPGDVLGYRVAKLLERVPGKPAPPFSDPGFQTWLRDRMADARRNYLLAVARNKLLARAYGWPQAAPAGPSAQP